MRKLLDAILGTSVVFVFATIVVCSPTAHSEAVRAPDKKSISVEIMVTNRSSEPLTYEYVVINNARLPVHRIALGRAEKVAAEMENMPENVPVSVSSPPGWAGKTLFGYESKYMNIAWVANKGVAGIQPGSRLGGFVLTMPARSGQLARDEDGREQRPMDMMRIPYVVTFDDTSEQVGVVKPPEK